MSQQIVVKGYQVGKKIDQSGLKSIYRAVHIASKQNVFLTLTPARSQGTAEILMRRAEQAQKLKHPNLVIPLDYGTVQSEFFFCTTPAIPSLPLADLLEQITDSRLFCFKLARYFIDLLEIVAYIHAARTTHRDITTHCLRVTRSGQLLLEGIVNSRLKCEGRQTANVVQLPYLSPEQLCGAAADSKTDIYSLGVVFYELITGALPYESNYVKIDESQKGNIPCLAQHRTSIPEEIELMSLKALSARAFRYNHVHEWINDLEAFHSQRSLLSKIKEISYSFKSLFAFKN